MFRVLRVVNILPVRGYAQDRMWVRRCALVGRCWPRVGRRYRVGLERFFQRANRRGLWEYRGGALWSIRDGVSRARSTGCRVLRPICWRVLAGLVSYGHNTRIVFVRVAVLLWYCFAFFFVLFQPHPHPLPRMGGVTESGCWVNGCTAPGGAGCASIVLCVVWN